jgi:hypothetical protein
MKRRRQECTICQKTYINTHLCHGGECPDCRASKKNLKTHKCPLRTALTFDPIVFVNSLLVTDYRADNGHICSRCGDWHAVTMGIVRMWKDDILCIDCYDAADDIRAEISHRKAKLRAEDIAVGRTTCSMCARILLGPNGKEVRRFEYDHINVFDKTDSVGHMLFSGQPMTVVFAEAAKCRVLCHRCHRLTTFVERQSGILKLKAVAANVPAHVLQTAHDKTTQAVDLLLMQDLGARSRLFRDR